MGSHSLLQGIFLTQGLNPGLLHRRQILYGLRHQGSHWEIVKDGEVWHAAVHGVAKSWTRLSERTNTLFCVWLLFHAICQVYPFCLWNIRSFIPNMVLTLWTYHYLLVHFTVDGYMGNFQFEAIMNNAAMNNLVNVFWSTGAVTSLGYKPWSGIAE